MARTSVRVRNNRRAIVSVALTIIGVASLGAATLLLMAYPPSEGHRSALFSAAAGPILLGSIVAFFAGPTAFFFGIVALRQIKSRKGEEKGKVLAWIGVVFGGVHIAFWIFILTVLIFIDLEEFLDELIFSLVAGAILIVPLWKIHARAGFVPATSSLVFVPYLGIAVVYFMLAFRRWPNTEIEAVRSEET